MCSCIYSGAYWSLNRQGLVHRYLIAFAYESPQCDTPIDALYDAYEWLIKNNKIDLIK